MRMCSLISGSSGNCIFFSSDKTSILIDAGASGKRIENALNSIDMTTKDIDGILITHEHSDHVKGLGVLARRYGIPMYATSKTIDAVRCDSYLGSFPDGLFNEIFPDGPFCVGDIDIKPFEIPHDAANPVGYRMEVSGKSAAVATDMGCYDDYIIDCLTGLDAILIESNHDVRMLEAGRYPYVLKRRILSDRGHLSNESAGKLLCNIIHDDLKYIMLGHLSKENNYEKLAFETVCSEVTMSDNSYRADEFDISIAHRDECGKCIEL